MFKVSDESDIIIDKKWDKLRHLVWALKIRVICATWIDSLDRLTIEITYLECFERCILCLFSKIRVHSPNL